MNKKILTILLISTILASTGIIFASSTVNLNNSSFTCPDGYTQVTTGLDGSLVVYSGNDGYFAVAEDQIMSSNLISQYGGKILSQNSLTVNNIPVTEYKVSYNGKTAYAYGFNKDNHDFIVGVLPNDLSNWDVSSSSNLANQLINSIKV